ncbi:diguanylate cyclase [uncultured Paraglaciecola sp.]|uniref:diguanylate cyclase domain-containing protein n=1 Tax=uncultured Paraglaciecola sp. TaxID=1765024 RepID=UPI00338EF80F
MDGTSVAVSFSFGVAATTHIQDKSISEFYKQANTCLYAAKNAGINGVFYENN